MINKCGIILLNKNNEILLVKQRISQKWGFPKGSRDIDDGNFFITSIRELYEETGIILYNNYNIVNDFVINKCYLIVIKMTKDTNIYIRDQNEIETARFFTIEEILDLKDCNSILNKYIKSYINYNSLSTKNVVMSK